MPRTLTLIALLIFLAASGCDKRKQAERDTIPRTPQKIDEPHLENAFRVTPKIWNGAEPHDDGAFLALKRLGVKTIISVDGAQPDVERARKHGLRYVHLPIGYDEVPKQRGKELAKAFDELPGPIYVHCHHGKHRSPAAAGVACVYNGTLDSDEAVAMMKVFGTGENYLGLWKSAHDAKPLDARELRRVKVHYVERAVIAEMADAMVSIDKYFDHLKACRNAGWRKPPNHPDLDPPHEALKIRQIYTEMQRRPDYQQRPRDFKQWIQESESGLVKLEEQLRAFLSSQAADAPKEISLAFQRLEKGCKDCHAKYRNVPQR